ncbi:MAG: YaiI/YqxD family protein [Bacteroidetes bacterium]|nr:YaiI/YqxD family protein [Bacteroidota bacterium]MBU1115054.1 YaiI/YqxD family protein [Bacteroidota bacterium]MBU1799545.1 YaiI/YqxD family protein [Bacteroidota bacterium]
MKLYIDGDAFPNLLKPIIYRAIEKLELQTFVVSNKRINIGLSNYINYVIVSDGADEADNRIVEMVEVGDLVITSDIPLADRVITKSAFALDHRGKFFDADNIKQSLAIRDFMQSIRDSGESTKGPKPINKKDAHEFANKLNQFLRRQITQ